MKPFKVRMSHHARGRILASGFVVSFIFCSYSGLSSQKSLRKGSAPAARTKLVGSTGTSGAAKGPVRTFLVGRNVAARIGGDRIEFFASILSRCAGNPPRPIGECVVPAARNLVT